MSIGDTYLLRDVQTLLGEDLMNTYCYVQTTEDGDAENLAETFVEVVLPDIQAIQNNGLVHNYVEVINYNDEEDFYTKTLGSGYEGDVSGEPLPRFNAWAYRINRSTRAVRNGSKRYAGVSENWLVSGVPGGTGVVEALEGLAETLAAELSGSFDGRYELRIASFTGGPGIPTPYPISGVTFVKPSTQNSRKR